MALTEDVVMQLAQADIQNPNNTTETAVSTLFLDCGSYRSYITKHVADALKLKRIVHEKLSVSTFGTTTRRELNTTVVKANLVLKNGEVMTLMLNVVPTITSVLKRPHIERMKLPIDESKLASDPFSQASENFTIDLLIGNDYYYDIIKEEKLKIHDGLYLVESKLGWVLTGRLKAKNEIKRSAAVTSLLGLITDKYPKIDPPLVEKLLLEDLWSLEKVGIVDSPIQTDDEYALKKFHDTLKFENKRYKVTWPDKDDYVDLPDNYQLAVGRLKSLVKKLQQNPEELKSYDDVIRGQETNKIVEVVNSDTPCGDKVHYVPHHPVYSPDKPTTKVRIVYDASAKTNKRNPSLNDCLYRGPVLLEDICGLLLRFRTEPIAVIADIEKAFHTLELQQTQRDLTRFLWLKDPTKPVTEDNIQTYRFVKVPFGVISSPFLLAATIQHHLENDNSEVAMKIRNNIYVDNVITGADSEEKAIQLYREGKELFSRASMNLREWLSNSEAFMKSIPEQDRACCTNAKVLGQKWNLKTDTLEIVVPHVDENTQWTKRTILGFIARIPDLLGFFSPTILLAKLLLQDLWLEEIDWDTELSPEQITRWLKILDSLYNITRVKIPRLVLNYEKGVKYELLSFCDASGKAFATVIYLRVVKQDEEPICVNLIFSKSRVLPKRILTIPKAEATSVEMGAKCLKYVETQLRLNISRKILWTDSQCVLYWLKSKRKLSRFIENRMKTLRSRDDIEFRYVTSSDNPADAATRGEDPIVLETSGHFTGPAWMRQHRRDWPDWNFEPIQQNVLADIEKEFTGPKFLFETSLVIGEDLPSHKIPYDINIANISNLSHLLRVTAWCTRLVNKISKKTNRTGPLTSDEIKNAQLLWDLNTQYQGFGDVIDKLKKGQRCDLITQLGLEIDKVGLLRCHHRLDNADLNSDTMNPKLLPKDHPYTKLVIVAHHKRLFHARTSHTLSQIRHEYWIPSGRRYVYHVIQDCSYCKKYHSGPYTYPKFPALPVARVTRSLPFTYAGVDYIGPLYMKCDNVGVKKVWICLYVCMAVRCISCQLMMDMTPEQFLHGLRRFIARCRKPDEVTLDNAPQFKVTKTAVDRAWQNVVQSDEVQSYVATQGIKWNFIPALSPWMGGFYERLVGVLKGSLRKAIGRVCMTRCQLETILAETEAVVNSRPLVYVGEDFEAGVALTPSHFLNGNWLGGTPILDDDIDDPEYLPDPDSADALLQLWKKGQHHLDELWKLWQNDYLLSLRERTQSTLAQPRVQTRIIPKIGDVVLIKEKLPRGTWKMGKIVELVHSPSDNEIRSAYVLLPNKHRLHRPINLLCPLEILDKDQNQNLAADNDQNQNLAPIPPVNDENAGQKRRPPTRAAAQAARQKFQNME